MGRGGEPVLLLGQDRSRWDRILIGRGLAALERARGLGGSLGPYALQAAIAAYHLFPSVRGDLLARLGRHEEARVEFERAAFMTRNARERALLRARADELGD